MRGHTSTGLGNSDEETAVPNEQRDGRAGGAEGDGWQLARGRWLREGEGADHMKCRDELRAEGFGTRCGRRRRRGGILGADAARTIAAAARSFTLAELSGRGRKAGQMREHQGEAKQDGYNGLHVVLVYLLGRLSQK